MNELQEIDLLDLLKRILKHFVSIILLTIVFATLGFAISKFVISPDYTSRSTMILGNKDSNMGGGNVELGQIQANKALVSTYSEIVKSRGVGDKVINNLSLDMSYEQLANKLSIEAINDTQIISVKVVDTIPERAADIANETSMIFKDSVAEIMNLDNVQILDKAIVPEKPSSPNIKKNTLIGAVLGFVISIGLVLIKELLDNRIKTIDDVTQTFDIPVLGLIPDKNKDK